MCALRAMASPLAFSLRAQIEIWMLVHLLVMHWCFYATVSHHKCSWQRLESQHTCGEGSACLWACLCILHSASRILQVTWGERDGAAPQDPDSGINAISDHFISNHVLLKADADQVEISITLILVSFSIEGMNFSPDLPVQGWNNLAVLSVTALYKSRWKNSRQ